MDVALVPLPILSGFVMARLTALESELRVPASKVSGVAAGPIALGLCSCSTAPLTVMPLPVTAPATVLVR